MKVLAVIVTHNRVDLLGRCIDHVQAQSFPTDVLVIDNASADGTPGMLQARGVDFVTQENSGSAGGWHRGIEAALERGYDAVWLMDDDGFPDRYALAALVDVLASGGACASSVVVCEDDAERFVFPFPVLDRTGLPVLLGVPRKIKTIRELAPRAKDGVYPFVHFFNGALINLDAVRKVGNVDRGFFLCGDEVDYYFRLREVGEVCSVLKAKHYHPDVGERPYSAAKIYYYVKNTLILNRRYFNFVRIRDCAAVCIVLWRTSRRNGVGTALSYIVGRNAPVLAMAVARGLQGRIGKDLDG